MLCFTSFVNRFFFSIAGVLKVPKCLFAGVRFVDSSLFNARRGMSKISRYQRNKMVSMMY